LGRPPLAATSILKPRPSTKLHNPEQIPRAT
jgi:hypothetical protein